MLNLTEVSTVALMLHDVILAALEHNQPFFIVADDVTRAVDHLGVSLVQRVLHEGGSSLLRVIVVTHGQRCTSYTELALHVCLLHQAVLVVEYEDVRVAAGIADRKGLLVGYLLINNIIGAVEGNLYGAVQIGKSRLRQMVMPVVVLLRGEYLASKPDSLQTFQLEG